MPRKMTRGLRQQQDASSNQGTRNAEGKRNRASPARLIQLYKDLTKPQRRLIEKAGFGGLLQIKCGTLPARLIDWLAVDCFDAESMELKFSGRGVIKVTAQAVQSILDLPNKGDAVRYELNAEAINFIQSRYKIAGGSAPKIRTLLDSLKSNKGATDYFLRSWLMLAISTFLCPPLGLRISPRCYPSIMDLSRVKDLKWCQFVVDQLKVAGSKMGTRKSLKGCVLVLVLLYVDSLLVDNVDIPTTMPRAAAWSRSLIDEVIKLDTNRDGSFGKLKLKSSVYTVVQSSLFQLDDVQRFVSSKVSSNMTDQKKRKLTTAVAELCGDFTNIVGNFLQKLSDIDQPSSSSSPHGDQRQARSRQARQVPDELPEQEDDEEEEDEEEEDEEEEEETAEEEDEEEEEEETTEEEDDSGSKEEQEDDPTGDEESDPHEADESDASEKHGSTPPPFDGPVHDNNSKDEHNNQDDVPLITRLMKIRQDSQAARDSSAARGKDDRGPAEPIPITMIVPENLQKDGGKDVVRNRKSKLRLPTNPVEQKDAGCSFKVPCSSEKQEISAGNVGEGNAAEKQEIGEGAKRHPLALTPPDFDLGISQSNRAEGSHSPCSLADISEATLQRLEDEAMEGSHSRTCSLDDISEATLQSLEDEAMGITSRKRKAHDEVPSSATKSVTPAYQPPPKRALKRPANLLSPYVDCISKKNFKCSEDVTEVYNAVCAHARSTRGSQSAEMVIVNFWEFFVNLQPLALSVKPGGHLHNTVAEIAIHVIDLENHKFKPVKQRVLPLRVATFLQSGQLDRTEVNRVFRAADNHLDHRQMVMFPVLEMMGSKEEETAGHYYLLVLNLRANRFEVLDSMRTLEDKILKESCNKIIKGIKAL